MSALPWPELAPTLYANPAFAAVLHEGLSLLGDGVPAADIEGAAQVLGWQVGPLALIDALGLAPIDAALHATQHTGHGAAGGCCGSAHHHHDHHHHHHHAHHHPEHASPAATLTESAIYVVEKMAHGYRRKGAASDAGFYDYSHSPPQLWSGLKAFERRGYLCGASEVADRLRWSAWLAALPNAADNPEPALQACLGAEFPSTRAHAIAQIQALGEAAFNVRTQALALAYGPRFQLADSARVAVFQS